MREILEALVPWGARVIVAIQARSPAAADPLFRLLTYLGDPPFFLLLTTLIFWCVHKPFGLRLTLLLAVSLASNALLKEYVALPRPFVSYAEIEAKIMYSGYTFPSGHAQTAATVWPALARWVGKRWFTALAIVLFLLISFSRIYLGVHYPQDAIAGILIGLGLFALYVWIEPPIERWLLQRSTGQRLVMALALPLAAGLAYPGLRTAATAGLGAGLAAGYVLEEEAVRFRPFRGGRYCLARLGVGLLLAGILYLAPLALFPRRGLLLSWPPATFVHLAVVGAAITLLIPWLFTRVGLALVDLSGGTP